MSDIKNVFTIDDLLKRPSFEAVFPACAKFHPLKTDYYDFFEFYLADKISFATKVFEGLNISDDDLIDLECLACSLEPHSDEGVWNYIGNAYHYNALPKEQKTTSIGINKTKLDAITVLIKHFFKSVSRTKLADGIILYMLSERKLTNFTALKYNDTELAFRPHHLVACRVLQHANSYLHAQENNNLNHSYTQEIARKIIEEFHSFEAVRFLETLKDDGLDFLELGKKIHLAGTDANMRNADCIYAKLFDHVKENRIQSSYIKSNGKPNFDKIADYLFWNVLSIEEKKHYKKSYVKLFNQCRKGKHKDDEADSLADSLIRKHVDSEKYKPNKRDRRFPPIKTISEWLSEQHSIRPELFSI
jgi:hypothetical protein